MHPKEGCDSYLCFCSLNCCQKELLLALAHCLLTCHGPSQRWGRSIPFPVLWDWWEWFQTAEKRESLCCLKEPWTPCASPFSPSSLFEDVCVRTAGLLPSVFCGSALTLFSCWQTGTAWSLLLFWSGSAHFSSGLLVCFWESSPPLKWYFPWVPYLTLPKRTGIS